MTADVTRRTLVATPKGVQIGKRYTGKPQGFADTTAGVYWEAMTQPNAAMSLIQRALLYKGKK